MEVGDETGWRVSAGNRQTALGMVQNRLVLAEVQERKQEPNSIP